MTEKESATDNIIAGKMLLSNPLVILKYSSEASTLLCSIKATLYRCSHSVRILSLFETLPGDSFYVFTFDLCNSRPGYVMVVV